MLNKIIYNLRSDLVLVTFIFNNSSLPLHACAPHHRSYPWESRHAEDLTISMATRGDVPDMFIKEHIPSL